MLPKKRIAGQRISIQRCLCNALNIRTNGRVVCFPPVTSNQQQNRNWQHLYHNPSTIYDRIERDDQYPTTTNGGEEEARRRHNLFSATTRTSMKAGDWRRDMLEQLFEIHTNKGEFFWYFFERPRSRFWSIRFQLKTAHAHSGRINLPSPWPLSVTIRTLFQKKVVTPQPTNNKRHGAQFIQ